MILVCVSLSAKTIACLLISLCIHFRNHIPISFPSTRKALWCHTALGSAVTLTLPRLNVSVTEQVLYLTYGQSRSYKIEECFLCGNVKTEPDCSEVSLFIDQLNSEQTATHGGTAALRTQVCCCQMKRLCCCGAINWLL